MVYEKTSMQASRVCDPDLKLQGKLGIKLGERVGGVENTTGLVMSYKLYDITRPVVNKIVI